MTKKLAPPMSDRKPDGEDRATRLAAALRANLARRKAQSRARGAGAGTAPAPSPAPKRG